MSAAGMPMSPWLEEAWLRRYLDRELTADETEWFEVYAIDKPALLERMDADSDLRDGLAAQAAAPAASPRPARVAALPASRPRMNAWFARAAGLVVALGAGWFAATLSSRDAASGMDVDIDPARIVFDTQRGAEDEPMAFNARSGSRYVLVEVGVPTDASDAELLLPGRPARALAVTSEGFLTFLLPRVQTPGAQVVVRYRTGGRLVTRTLDLSRIIEGKTS